MQSLSTNERLQRGTVDFPIEYYHLDRSHPRYIMQLHWHVENELIRVLRGSFRIALDGRQCVMEPGDLCLIGDGVLHEGSSQDCEYECVVFSIELLRHRNYLDDAFIARAVGHAIRIDPIIRLADQGPVLPALAGEMFDSLRRGTPDRALTTCAAMRYLFALVERKRLYTEAPFTSTYGTKRTMQIKKALDLIETSYGQNLSLGDLARSAGLSSKYFCVFFRSMTDKTPIEYLNTFRIEKACNMIDATDKSLIEISMDCGFNSYNYFIQAFRRFKGVTPHRYRLGCRGEGEKRRPPARKPPQKSRKVV